MNTFVPLENPEEVVSILSQISIFGGVSDVQQQEIFSRLQVGMVKKGESIFQQGDEPSHIYIIEGGLVELFIPDREHSIEKKRLGVGECFGQVAVMSIHQHTISAVALEDTTLIVLFRRALYQPSPGRHPPFCHADDEHCQGTGSEVSVHRRTSPKIHAPA